MFLYAVGLLAATKVSQNFWSMIRKCLEKILTQKSTAIYTAISKMQIWVTLDFFLYFNLSIFFSIYISRYPIYLGESANQYEPCGTSPNRHGTPIYLSSFQPFFLYFNIRQFNNIDFSSEVSTEHKFVYTEEAMLLVRQ